MNKYVFVLLSVSVIVLFFTGCSGSGGGDSNQTASVITTKYINNVDLDSTFTIKGANQIIVEESLAYLINNDGFYILDINDIDSPRILGFESSSNAIVSVSIKDQYAYALSLNGDLKVINIYDSSNPRTVSTIANIAIAKQSVIVKSYLYLLNSSSAIDIYSLIDSSNPVWEKQLAFSASFGMVEGDFLYLATTTKLFVLDITDPLNPQEVDSINTTGTISDMALYEENIYVSTLNNGLEIIDISNPNNLKFVAALPLSFSGSGLAIEVDKGYAYIIVEEVVTPSSSNYLVDIIDVKIPTSPALSVSTNKRNKEISSLGVIDEYFYAGIYNDSIDIYQTSE